VVVSVTDQINEPRYPSFQTMRAARAKPVEQWTLDDLAEGEGLPPSSTRVLEAGAVGRSGPGTVIADSGDAGERLARYLIEEAE
jgi:electron transfer flavoprotein beta subunit